MTGAQAAAYAVIWFFAWGGLAALFGVAVGKTIADAGRRERPTQVPARETAPVVELGTRLDVRL